MTRVRVALLLAMVCGAAPVAAQTADAERYRELNDRILFHGGPGQNRAARPAPAPGFLEPHSVEGLRAARLQIRGFDLRRCH